MGVYIKENGQLKPVTVNTLIKGATPIPPTGNIDITTTETVDVTAYATAKVVDSDLAAGNIKKDVNILGITGTYEGSGPTPTGNINITTTETVDVSDYATAKVVDSDLVAGNIKKDVNILGVTGTYEGEAEKPVRFFDYDGTLVAAYDAEEFQELTALPANPTHQGLTAQGWNWSLADAKAFVLSRGGLDIGQNYITTDGKTRIYVRLTEALKNGLKLSLAVSGTVSVDWGDNSSPSTLSGSSSVTPVSVTHDYSTAGDYIIAITPSGVQSRFYFVAGIDGSALLDNYNSVLNMRRSYLASVTKIELGTNAGINQSGLEYCINLTALNIPIGTYTGDNMVSNTDISAIIIPDGNVTAHTIHTKILSLPATIVIIHSPFEGRDVVYIPDGVYDISSLESNAKSIILPSALTEIPSYCFQSCKNLTSIDLKAITKIGMSAFSGCHHLTDITMDNVTSIGYGVFMNCWCLRDLVLPNITSIPDNLFSSCYSLNSVTIPASVTQLGKNMFQACKALSQIKFKGDTPPNATDVSWYATVPTSCKILVPEHSLAAYTSATNYPDPDVYTYEEYTEVE